MWRIYYYLESNGNQPVAGWLDTLDKKISVYLQDKIVRLQQNGLILLNTSMMKTLKGERDFYEIKYGNYRIALYLDTEINTFVLLHGFKKERKRESKEIDIACSRLREYKSRRKL
jgi:mRNA-degrading endonuclease RelE of RelBE toxin-antitoxin system